jgi:hypothetical protein
MSKLAAMVEADGRGSLPKNNGLPTLDLNDMQGISIPLEYAIENVLGDILMCEIIDETDNGEVNRNGIWLKQDVTGKMWRVAKVIKMGPECSGVVKLGDCVMYPSDKGLPVIKVNKKYVFLNEPRIFCTCTPIPA